MNQPEHTLQDNYSQKLDQTTNDYNQLLETGRNTQFQLTSNHETLESAVKHHIIEKGRLDNLEQTQDNLTRLHTESVGQRDSWQNKLTNTKNLINSRITQAQNQVNQTQNQLNSDPDNIPLRFDLSSAQEWLKSEQELLSQTEIEYSNQLTPLIQNIISIEADLEEVNSQLLVQQPKTSSSQTRLNNSLADWNTAREAEIIASKEIREFINTHAPIIPSQELESFWTNFTHDKQQSKERLENLTDILGAEYTSDSELENLISDSQTYLKQLNAELKWSEEKQQLLSNTDFDSLTSYFGSETVPDVIQLQQLIQKQEKTKLVNQQQQEIEVRSQTKDAIESALVADNLSAYSGLREKLRNDSVRNLLVEVWTQNVKTSQQKFTDVQSEYVELIEVGNVVFSAIPSLLADANNEVFLDRVQLSDSLAVYQVQSALETQLGASQQFFDSTIDLLQSQINQTSLAVEDVQPFLDRYDAQLEGFDSYFADSKVKDLDPLIENTIAKQQQIHNLEAQIATKQNEKNNVLAAISNRNGFALNPINKNYYFLTDTTLTWHQAQDVAESIHSQYANLVTIDGMEEDLPDEIRWLNHVYPRGRYWTGLNDIQNEGQWEWVSGDSSTFFEDHRNGLWMPGQPNDYRGIDEDAVEISLNLTHSAYWNDKKGFERYKGLIEVVGTENINIIKEDHEFVVHNPTNDRYYFYTENASGSWPQMQKYAQYYGGNLVSINDLQEQIWLSQHFHGFFWTGAIDPGRRGKWEWLDGTSVDHSNNSGTRQLLVQRNGSHGLVQLRTSYTDTLNNLSVNSLRRGVIEVDVKPLENEIETLKDQVKTVKQELQNSEQDYDNKLTSVQDSYQDNPLAMLALKEKVQTVLGDDVYRSEQLQANIFNLEARANAADKQAQWYEDWADTYWDLSRKQGRTWTETRTYKKKGLLGSKKEKVVIIHVDHYWVLWNAYDEILAPNLRSQAEDDRERANQYRQQLESIEGKVSQWRDADNTANQAQPAIEEARNLARQIAATEFSITLRQEQRQVLQSTLNKIQTQFNQARTEAENSNATVLAEWAELEISTEAYRIGFTEVLKSVTNLKQEVIEVRFAATELERWSEEHTSRLNQELIESIPHQNQLKTKIEALNAEIAITTGSDQKNLITKKTLLQESLELLEVRSNVIETQQSALEQHHDYLQAIESVIETQEDLVEAYLISPDDDFSNIQDLLEDTRNVLAEAQRLAQQASENSQGLVNPIKAFQSKFLTQNDIYVKSSQEKQEILTDLIEAIDLKANYVLKAVRQQRSLNEIETQLRDRLQEAANAGSSEAKALLDIASNQGMKTAAEIYFRDYADLATDTGGGCTGGIARPEDRQLAEYYQAQMLKHQQLQTEAEEQAEAFAQVRSEAEEQVEFLRTQQSTATELLNELNEQIGSTQGNIDDLQQDLAISESRFEVINELKQQTELALTQLITIEQLNLQQAQLEQQIGLERDQLIDEVVEARLQRETLEIELQRQNAIVKLESLEYTRSLQDQQQALAELRLEVGLDDLDEIVNQYNTNEEYIGIVLELQALEDENPELPASVKTLLADVKGDIHEAIRADEAAEVLTNLATATNEINTIVIRYQAEIAELEQQEQQDLAILDRSKTDLQGALKELIEASEVSDELNTQISALSQQQRQLIYEIAFAQDAVEMTAQMSEESENILTQIIDQRVEERKIRRKSSVNAYIGEIVTVIAVAAAIITAGVAIAGVAQGLTVSAALSSTTSPFASYLTASTTLKTVGAAISAVQSAYNGDWSGAIFNAGIAALGAADIGKLPVPNLGLGLEHITEFGQIQQVASGVYNGSQAFEAGDGLTGFLNLVSAALPIGAPEYSYLSKAALSINSGVKLAEEDEWLAATSSFLNGAFSLTSSLNGEKSSFGIDLEISPLILDIISTTGHSLNILSGISGIISSDSLEGWLDEIKNIANSIENYYSQQGIVNELTNFRSQLVYKNILEKPDITSEEIKQLADKYGVKNIFSKIEEKILVDENGKQITIKDKIPYIIQEFELDNNNKGGLLIRKEFDSSRPTILTTFGWLNDVSPEWAFYASQLLSKIYPEHNIMIGDWSENSQNINYLKAASDTQLAGQKMAEELHRLGVNFNQLTLIGHSLGAQVAGAIGEYAIKQNYGEVASVFGLDPARPSFERSPLILLKRSSDEGRLDTSDATEVSLVRSDHNSIFSLGYRNPLGSQDIKLTRSILDYYGNPNVLFGRDHQVAITFLIDALENNTSLDNLGKFLEKKEQDLLASEQNQTRQNRNSLGKLRTNLLETDNLSVDYNNPLPSYLEESGSSFGSYNIDNDQIFPLDPIIIDLDGNGLELSNVSVSTVFFDIDADGYLENTAWTTDGILSFDLNKDGIINNITEVFSEHFNDGSFYSGLEALATLDSNQNDIISAIDTQFSQILVWQDINQDGVSQANELKTLSDHGIASINLNGITTETTQEGNIIKKRSIFHRNDGTSGQISDVAFLVTQTGFKVNQIETGIEILAENDTAISLIIHEQFSDFTLNLADSNIQTAIGNIGNDYLYTTGTEDIFLSGDKGNDTLEGGSGNDYLFGGEGADQLKAGAGDDIVYIDAQDTLIDGGAGTDIAIVNTSDGVTFDLGLTNLEIFTGNEGNDVISNSGNHKVVVDGGKGNDQITGGTNDDVLTGGLGVDFIFGKEGDDLLYAGNTDTGKNTLLGGAGQDTLHGGQGFDKLYGNEDLDIIYGHGGNDIMQGGAGKDQLIGGAGDDILVYRKGDNRDLLADGGHSNGDRVFLTSSIQVGTDAIVLEKRAGKQDLDIFINGFADHIRISNQFVGTANRIEYFHLDNTPNNSSDDSILTYDYVNGIIEEHTYAKIDVIPGTSLGGINDSSGIQLTPLTLEQRNNLLGNI